MKKLLCIICMLTCALFSFSQEKQWKDINYADDNLEGHKLDIYLPGNGQGKYKVIVLIYGSAWYSNNAKQMAYQSLGKPLLDAGFAVVSINHRSSSDAKFPAQINDVKAAIRYIRGNAAKYNLDPSFIGITGFSSGGHLSALAGTTNGVKNYTVGSKSVDIEGNLGKYTKFSSNVDAVCDWFGPLDMTKMENCSTTKDAKSPEAALIGGAPADNLDMLALLNPQTYLDKNDPKFMVIHGTADNVVPDCQSKNFSAALKDLKLLDEFISVPDGQHGPITFNEVTFKKMSSFFTKVAKKDIPNSYEEFFYNDPAEKVAVDNEGFIRRWMILEPISKPSRTNAIFTDSYLNNVFDTVYFAKQQTMIPKAGQVMKVGKQKLAWHAVDCKKFNVKLFRFSYAKNLPIYGVLFWNVAVINCDQEMKDVRLAVGSNSGSKWWVNGEPVLLLSNDRRMVKDDCVSPRLTLKKGINIVRGAVINGPGMSDFCVRFIDENGEPVKGITVSYK